MRGWLASLHLALLALVSCCCAGKTAAVEHWLRDQAAEALFSQREPVPQLSIEIADDDMNALRHSRNARSGGPRPEVLVTVREGTNRYELVSLHLKGSGGSFQPVDAKPALTLHFNERDSGQRFHGLEKVSLNNSIQDKTFLCEYIGRRMFAAAGIPVPRSTHATVTLNGRRLGLYVLVEGWNKSFLQRHFADAKGNFYEPAFRADLPGPFPVKSGVAPDDHRAVEALAAAVNEPDEERRWAALGRTLDRDRFIDFMALEVLLDHWDGYGGSRNNYRIFHDRSVDKIVYLPHGLDQLFALRRPQSSMGFTPPWRGRVASAVMETSAGRRQYFERLGWLLNHVWHIAPLTKEVLAMAARLRPQLTEERDRTLFDSQVKQLLLKMEARHAAATKMLSQRMAPALPEVLPAP